MPRVKTLVTRLKEATEQPDQANHFPDVANDNYYHAYTQFESWLKRNVHNNVNQVAMMIDGGYLTDHGPGHIKTVIQRASDLLGTTEPYPLGPYEIFMLLTAIQVHDAGHIIGGRTGHEQNTQPLLKHLDVDRTEQVYIGRIARAHGGKLPDGDKDTIEKGLPIKDTFNSVSFRPRFLASLLRFADELADDRTRSARYVHEQGILPTSSEVYHAYAEALYSVDVYSEKQEIELSFELPAAKVDTPSTKGKKDEEGNEIIDNVYLLDEIFNRTYKMYQECVYCMRFFPAELQIKTITVKINVVDDDTRSPIHEPIGYQLKERGYPQFLATTIEGMCGPDIMFEGTIINGAILKQRIQRRFTSSTPTT
ncbi:HD domain-containing protein [Fibrella aquatilis]|uniref:HD-CE domain-containing protein n=1 Tax=Fibrella aquatilis TaxID=2817059 RepID=A0A939G835_9BACT|nr:hypothetical protein [Fibrella aquatilis]MBO0931892.1 hypothetical protein [Fibrella aquatilis]